MVLSLRPVFVVLMVVVVLPVVVFVGFVMM